MTQGRVAPGGLIHTGGSVDTPRAFSFPSLVLGGHRAPVCAATWIGDSQVLTGSHDSTAKVWDAKSGLCELTLEGHEGPVLCVACDGQRVPFPAKLGLGMKFW
eukprot:s730_g27.t1